MASLHMLSNSNHPKITAAYTTLTKENDKLRALLQMSLEQLNHINELANGPMAMPTPLQDKIDKLLAKTDSTGNPGEKEKTT